MLNIFRFFTPDSSNSKYIPYRKHLHFIQDAESFCAFREMIRSFGDDKSAWKKKYDMCV